MADPMSHDDLLNAQSVLMGLVEGILTEVNQAPETAALIAAACAFVALCDGAGVDYDTVLDQALDAYDAGLLPDGIMSFGVTKNTVWH